MPDLRCRGPDRREGVPELRRDLRGGTLGGGARRGGGDAVEAREDPVLWGPRPRPRGRSGHRPRELAPRRPSHPVHRRRVRRVRLVEPFVRGRGPRGASHRDCPAHPLPPPRAADVRLRRRGPEKGISPPLDAHGFLYSQPDATPLRVERGVAVWRNMEGAFDPPRWKRGRSTTPRLRTWAARGMASRGSRTLSCSSPVRRSGTK